VTTPDEYISRYSAFPFLLHPSSCPRANTLVYTLIASDADIEEVKQLLS